MDRLPREFYQRPAEEVARDLLGRELVSTVDGRLASGVVVETEAYLGIAYSACHAAGGRRTARTESLYRAGGHAYVYLVYGLHWCLNITTGPPDEPTCVLIRALEPLAGIEAIRERRPVKDERRLTDGPGKLCQALARILEQQFFNHLLLAHGAPVTEEGKETLRRFLKEQGS